MNFTKDDDAKLCELVSTYSALYDFSNGDFKNIILKDNIWKEIALALGEGKNDEHCKKRWRTIRDHYKRLKREGKLGTGSAAKKSVNWPLLKYLSFLNHVPEERSTQSNIPDIEQYEELSNNTFLDVEGENEDFCTPSPSLPPPSPASDISSTISKKRKLDRVSDLLIENREARVKLLEKLDETNKKEDEIDAFYKSIALSVKRLPPLLKAEAKMQHLQILHNLELKHMQSQQQHQQPYYYSEAIPPLMQDSRSYHQNNLSKNYQQLTPVNLSYLHQPTPQLPNMSESPFEHLDITTKNFDQLELPITSSQPFNPLPNS